MIPVQPHTLVVKVDALAKRVDENEVALVRAEKGLIAIETDLHVQQEALEQVNRQTEAALERLKKIEKTNARLYSILLALVIITGATYVVRITQTSKWERKPWNYASIFSRVEKVWLTLCAFRAVICIKKNSLNAKDVLSLLVATLAPRTIYLGTKDTKFTLPTLTYWSKC